MTKKKAFREPETAKAFAFRMYREEEDRVGIDLADAKFGGRTIAVRVIREKDYQRLLKAAREKKS